MFGQDMFSSSGVSFGMIFESLFQSPLLIAEMDMISPCLCFSIPLFIPGFLSPSELYHDLVLKSYLNVFRICLMSPDLGSNVHVPVTGVANGCLI